GFVCSQTLGHVHARWQRRAKESPGLIRSAWHGAHFREFRVRVLGPVSPAERAHHAYQLAPEFQTTIDDARPHELRQERVARDKDMGARSQGADRELRPADEELAKHGALSARQRGEARERRALVAIEARRDPPDAAAIAVVQATELIGLELLHTIRRIRD